MGCGPSKETTTSRHRAGKSIDDTTGFTAVGSTERNFARKDRLKASPQQLNNGQSKKAGGEEQEENRPLPKLDENGKLTPEEVAKRTLHSNSTKTIQVGTEEFPIEIRFASWTQRGYYPDDPHKANQDDLAVTSPFAGEKMGAMFSVFDGHGKKGHDCAGYAKKHLPRLAEKYIRQARVKKYRELLKKEGRLKGAKLFDPSMWPYLSPEEYKISCRKAFLDCNREMQESSVVDAELSGTTAISASFHGNMISVCNVGDSRVILGHRVPNPDGAEGDGQEEKVLAIPLSRDQTPYRKDERERVKRLGAAVMSIDQIEGLEPIHENFGDLVLGKDVDYHGDPPRVWVEGKNYPGCAFTRSLGDGLAESIGVTAEPEMICRELTVNDQILILASDGLFEFLTNQEVMDLARRCGDPLKACGCLVEASYKQWLMYERRTDDITIIVCYIKCTKPIPAEGEEGTTEDLVGLANTAYGTKPVRRPRGTNDTLFRDASSVACSTAE